MRRKLYLMMTTTTKTMMVMVMIRYAVELDEKEMTGNKKFSGEQLFKTAGVTKVMMSLLLLVMMVMEMMTMMLTKITLMTMEPQVVRLSASDFTVGYHWDPVRQVTTF